MQYQVGQPFPSPKVLPGADYPLASFNEAFLDVLFYSSDANADKKIWGADRLTLYFYEASSVQFIAAKFEKLNIDFDVSLNFLKTMEQPREAWLAGTGNLMTLFLIDANTNLLAAMRTVSVNFAPELREGIGRQLAAYQSVEAVEAATERVLATTATNIMMRDAKKKISF